MSMKIETVSVSRSWPHLNRVLGQVCNWFEKMAYFGRINGMS